MRPILVVVLDSYDAAIFNRDHGQRKYELLIRQAGMVCRTNRPQISHPRSYEILGWDVDEMVGC